MPTSSVQYDLPAEEIGGIHRCSADHPRGERAGLARYPQTIGRRKGPSSRATPHR